MTRRHPAPPSAAGSGAVGQASGKHQGLHRPADDQRVEHALDHVSLEDRGELMEDHQRDRHSKGVRDGYDDSVDTRKKPT